MTEKIVNAKQPDKPKAVQVQKAKTLEKAKDKAEENAIQHWWRSSVQRWWRETIGELRKVSWPTPAEARRLTGIVLVVMFSMSALLGLLDFVFSRVITALVK